MTVATDGLADMREEAGKATSDDSDDPDGRKRPLDTADRKQFRRRQVRRCWRSPDGCADAGLEVSIQEPLPTVGIVGIVGTGPGALFRAPSDPTVQRSIVATVGPTDGRMAA